MKNLLPRSVLCVSISMTFSHLSSAQDIVTIEQERVSKDKREATATTQQSVEIRSKIDPRRNHTASTIVVSNEEIMAYGDTNMAEVLKRLPGVSIPSSSTPTVITFRGRRPVVSGGAAMRGMGSYTSILVNGEPSPPGFSLDSLSPSAVERVEIVRSAKAEISTQSIAGSLNIILKEGIELGKHEAKVGFHFTDAHTAGSTSLNLVGKMDGLSFTIPFQFSANPVERRFQSTENAASAIPFETYHRNFEGSTRGNLHHFNAQPRLSWKSESGDSLFLSNAIVSLKSNTDKHWLSTETKRESQQRNQYQNRSQISNTMLTSSLHWIRRLDGGDRLESRFGLKYSDRNSNTLSSMSNIDASLNSSITPQLRRYTQFDSDEHGASFSGKYTSHYLPQHDLVVGWDAGKSQRRDRSYQNGDQNLQNSIVTDFDVQHTRLAVFAQDEWSWSKPLSIYLGLRWEGIRNQNRGNFTGTFSHSTHVLSPIANFLYKFEDLQDDQLRIGIARTYKAPETINLVPRKWTSLYNTAATPDSTGNPQLLPELSWGIDIGWDHYFSDSGSLGLNVFYRHIEDVTLDRTVLQDHRWLSMPINDGTARTYGIELDTKFPMKLWAPDAPDIEWRANFAFNFSNVDNVRGPHNRLDTQIPITVNLGVDYKVSGHPLRFGANFNFQSGGVVHLSNQQRLYSSYKRNLDYFALWSLDHATQLRVSVSNALHQPSFDQGWYEDDARTIQRTSTNESRPSIKLNLERRF